MADQDNYAPPPPPPTHTLTLWFFICPVQTHTFTLQAQAEGAQMEHFLAVRINLLSHIDDILLTQQLMSHLCVSCRLISFHSQVYESPRSVFVWILNI